MFGTLFATCWWMVPLAAFALYWRSASGRRLLHAVRIDAIARARLDQAAYRMIKNVTLPTDSGHWRLDRVLVSRFGIFLIKTDHATGWIAGGPRKKIWTQTHRRRSTKIPNPLWQNHQHMRALGKLLGLHPAALHSLIVFTGHPVFQMTMPDNVVRVDSFVAYILSKDAPVLSTGQVDAVVRLLRSGQFAPRPTSPPPGARRVVHGAPPRPLHSTRARAAGAPDAGHDHCPECGAALLLCTMKTGPNIGQPFVGCSTFPSCKFIVHLPSH